MNFATATLTLSLAVFSGCVFVPSEAPILSSRLGEQISHIEHSHVRLIDTYFKQKRDQIDRFVEQVWVPEFAQAFFAGTDIQHAWDEIVRSGNAQERLKLLTLAGPALLARINAKRQELVGPLNGLKRTLKRRVTHQYQQARATNNAITAYLRSAREVNETRDQYLAMAGIEPGQFDQIINKADTVVQRLVGVTGRIADRAGDIRRFRDQMQALENEIRQIN